MKRLPVRFAWIMAGSVSVIIAVAGCNKPKETAPPDKLDEMIGARLQTAVKLETQPTIKLANGSVLTVKRVTFGGPRPTFSYAGEHADSTLDLWFHQTGRPDGQMLEDVYFTVTDDSGIEHFPSGFGSYRCLTTNCIGERLGDSHFDAFPRRATNLTFYVHTVGPNSQWIVADSFKLRNPARGPFQAWQPEPLPATRQDGPYTFSLKSLTVKVGPTEERPTTNTSGVGTRAVFQVTTNGAADPDWRVESVRLKDATGNVLYLWAGDRGIQTDGHGLFSSVNRWLDPAEPAWKVRAEFSRVNGFAPDDLVTIKGFSTNGMSMTGKVRGIEVSVNKLVHESNWGGNACVDVSVWPRTEDFRIALVKAVDDRGREIPVVLPPQSYGNFYGGYHSFGLELPSDSRTLDLTFAYRACRFAEFTVKPSME